MATSKTFDSNLYNTNSEHFIPVACHYDEHTLLTKNGELLQTIQIKGIDAENISENLSDLREVVRKSIQDAISCHKFAFWIHTIRSKADLNDGSGYSNILSENIHDIWRIKNHLSDKFVNTLYITVIHRAPELKIKNLNSWMHSFSLNTISDFEERFFAGVAKELNNTVNLIMEGMSEYCVNKLGIIIEGEECYSDPMFLYRRIMQMNEEKCLVPISDISKSLSSHQYAIGNDQIEVMSSKGKNFAALMSIKEYREVSPEALDIFLQIPVEMVVTEVFYFVDRESVVSSYKDQDYILSLSEDTDLRRLKGLDVIMGKDPQKVSFCQQQISFMVIGASIKELDERVYCASEALSKLGIIHVREDTNLEKTFWAQLPANFSFLARMRPTVSTNITAFASLHYANIGNQYNAWGKALTLLNAEKGTPYFVNFHDKTNIGTTCIFGESKSGKTTLMNFLVSEAEKYNPTTLYLTSDMDSGLYIKARGGKWFQRNSNIANPLMCEDTKINREFIFNFFKVISQHYFNPLTNDELIVLKAMSETIFKLPREKRKLSIIIPILKASIKGGESLAKRLEMFLPDGVYSGVFERDDPIEVSEGGIVAINLQSFDDAAYIKANRPKELKLVEQFEYDLHVMGSVKAAIVLSAQNIMHNLSDGPKIFAVDDLSELMNFEYYGSLFPVISNNMSSINGVFVSSVNIDVLYALCIKDIPQDWMSSINTSFILPSELSMLSHKKVLNLTESDLKKLSKVVATSRQFLIQQDGEVLASELDIDDLPGVSRILCSVKEERAIYKEIIKKHGNEKIENWVQPLFEELDNVI